MSIPQNLIDRSNSKFDNNFDFSHVNNYRSQKTEIRVVCRKHDKRIVISYGNHIGNKYGGCLECQQDDRREKNLHKLIEKSKQKFGDIFDFSETIHPGVITIPLKIKCILHDQEILISQRLHLQNDYGGCGQCQSDAHNEYYFNDLIEFSNKKYNNRFDFSNSIYLGETPITIRCKLHDEMITILPDRHKRNKYGGCKTCELRGTTINFETFSQRSLDKFHGNFELFEGEYRDYTRTKTNIKCLIHDKIISIIPHDHIDSKYGGCSECHYSTESEQNLQKFMAESNEKFKNNFDFSRCIYKNNITEVELRCIRHDYIFNITRIKHMEKLYGGCPHCKQDLKPDIVIAEDEIVADLRIPGLEHLYAVTSKGRCFSKRTNKELSAYVGHGYYFVGIRGENMKDTVCMHVHYLVYISFKNDYVKGYDIDHINSNKLDNCIENLQCITHQANCQKAHDTGCHNKNKRVIQLLNKKEELIGEFLSTAAVAKFLNYETTHSVLLALRANKNKNVKLIREHYVRYKEHIDRDIYIEDISEYVAMTGIYDDAFDHYYINKEGIIVNSNNKNRVTSQHISLAGYKTIKLHSPIKDVTIHVHRLLARYFLDDGEKYFDIPGYVVNHIDENKLNNSVFNLEFCTSKENTEHSCAKRVAQIDIKTGEIIKIYRSIKRAVQSLGIGHRSHISKVCDRVPGYDSAYKFYWEWVDEEDLDEEDLDEENVDEKDLDEKDLDEENMDEMETMDNKESENKKSIMKEPASVEDNIINIHQKIDIDDYDEMENEYEQMNNEIYDNLIDDLDDTYEDD